MKLVLLSGGSGKRLWPLSNDSRSKQFLKVLFNNSTKKYESMLQRFWRQLEELNLSKDTIIATSKSQSEMIEMQIGVSKKVIEPERRDTFAAIVLSCVYLYDVEKISLEENIIIAPVDPYVEDSYFERMKEISNYLDDSDSELILMGITPNEPSEKFGYILPTKEQKDNQNLSRVLEFKEKPNRNLAEKLIDEGALWNSGVFGFKLKALINYLVKNNYSTDYKFLLNNYKTLPSNSFDYEFVEKCNSISVLKYEGMWKDLGTWNTLLTELNSKVIGNVVRSETCYNTKVINELEIPIVVMGVKNSIIAASPDGILISDINESENIKEKIKNFDNTPMFVERNWGSYKILDYVKHGHTEVITKRLKINATKKLSYHYHNKRKETWTIISGEAEIVLDGLHSIIGSGKTIEIEAGVRHSIQAITDIELIELQRGMIEELDVYRLSESELSNKL